MRGRERAAQRPLPPPSPPVSPRAQLFPFPGMRYGKGGKALVVTSATGWARGGGRKESLAVLFSLQTSNCRFLKAPMDGAISTCLPACRTPATVPSSGAPLASHGKSVGGGLSPEPLKGIHCWLSCVLPELPHVCVMHPSRRASDDGRPVRFGRTTPPHLSPRTLCQRWW